MNQELIVSTFVDKSKVGDPTQQLLAQSST